MAHYTVEELRTQLPEVGAELVKQPTVGKSLGICSSRPQHCVVEFVNTEHLWYRVRFDSGYCETYKLPEIDVADGYTGSGPKRVRCIDTGAEYDSLKDAAEDTGISTGAISSACSGRKPMACGLRWEFITDDEELVP